MTLQNVHPKGFYGKHPEVTWDLAEERWLTAPTKRRSDILFAECLTCGWCNAVAEKLILAKPERQRIAEFITESQHWYYCHGDPQMEFSWLSDSVEGARPDG